MIKSELIERVAKSTGVTKADTKMMVNAVFDAITEELRSGSDVKLSGFGAFRTTVIDEHDGLLPSGETIKMGKNKRIRFKPSKEMRDKVNGA